MASIGAAERVEKAQAVSGSVETHGDAVAAKIVEELQPFLERGEVMPDVALFMRLVARRGAHVATAVYVADDAHEKELADDPPLRTMRDSSFTATRAVMTDLRDSVTTAHGADAARLLGLAKPPSEDPSVLDEEARRTLAALRDPATELPPARRRAISVDLEAFADELEDDLAPLSESLTALRREGRESEKTLTAKQSALSAFDRASGPGTALIIAAFDLAGRSDLADRILPVERRRSASPAPGPTVSTPTAE